MTRRWVWVLAGCLFLSGCGGSNPYLEQSLKPAELQGKDKAWFRRIGANPAAKLPAFSVAKPGPIIVSPAASRARPSSTSRPISVKSRSSSTKKKNSPTTVTLGANDLCRILPRHLFLERRCTALTTETIRLSSDNFGHR